MWIFARSHDKGASVSVRILGGWSFGRAQRLVPKGILSNLPDRTALFKDGAGRRINLFAILRLIQILGRYLVAACMHKFAPRVNRTKMFDNAPYPTLVLMRSQTHLLDVR
jgi:hypothetical protein